VLIARDPAVATDEFEGVPASLSKLELGAESRRKERLDSGTFLGQMGFETIALG
jgi:hypothetical protein